MKTAAKGKHPPSSTLYFHDLPTWTFTYSPCSSNMASECAPCRDLQPHHIICLSFQHPESAPRQQGV
jgi:hypothetical protein